jgi:hypothetical protein
MTYVCMIPFTYISVTLYFLSAIAWYISSRQPLIVPPIKDFIGVSNVGIPELVRRLNNQSKWNVRAAFLAAIAVLLQGLSNVSCT